MASDWNKLLERLLAEKLTVAEYRLTLALARLLLGWRRSGAHLGRNLIRETAGLDGRTFERARDGLVAKGLLVYQAGTGGRGNRGYYELELTTETAALARQFADQETAAVERPKRSARNRRSGDTKTAALQRPRRGKGKEKTLDTTRNLNNLRRQAFDTYQGAGGTLTLEKERGALARSVTAAANNGATDDEILAATRDLGRTHDFPGHLAQRITEIRENGGPCQWTGLDRSRLTPTQLADCTCQRCTQWLTALAGETPNNPHQHATKDTHGYKPNGQPSDSPRVPEQKGAFSVQAGAS